MKLVEAFFSMEPRRTKVCKKCLHRHYVDEIVVRRPDNLLFYLECRELRARWVFHGEVIATWARVGEATYQLELMLRTPLIISDLYEAMVERLNGILAYLRGLGFDLPNMRFRTKRVQVVDYVGRGGRLEVGCTERPIMYLEREGRKVDATFVTLLLDFKTKNASVSVGGRAFTFLDEDVATRHLERVFGEVLTANLRAWEAFEAVKKEFPNHERATELAKRFEEMKLKLGDTMGKTGLPEFLREDLRPFDVIASLRALQKDYEAYVDECKRTLAELRLLS